MNYTAQITARSMSKAGELKIRMTAKTISTIQLMAKGGFEVVAKDKGKPVYSPVDETEFWTEEDFEEHRLECHMTPEEYYGS